MYIRYIELYNLVVMYLRKLKFFSTSVFLVFALFLGFFHEKRLADAFFMEGIRFQVRTLTSDSFESDVIESQDAWILAIKGSKVSEDEWQIEENRLRGVVNVAFIELIADGQFMFEKGILDRDEPIPMAVVFPYGGTKTKKTQYKKVNSVKDAKRLALSSLSENYVSWIETKFHVEEFVAKAYRSWPPRFPVILTTEKKIIPPLYRAISIRYSRYFNFGVVHISKAHDVVGLAKGVKIPRLDILISTISPNESVSMNGLTYTEAYGPVKYPYLIRFLFSAHEKHWSELPGSKKYTDDLDYEDFYRRDLKIIFANPVPNDDETGKKTAKLPNITEITYDNHRKICDDSTKGFCIVAFLDGSPDEFEKIFQEFSEVHNIKHFQDKPLNFMWINASCYPEYGVTFGISLDSLPALLVAKPERRVFVMHSGKFNKNSIGEFMDKVFTGRISFSPYSRFDDLENRSCREIILNDYEEVPDVKNEEIKKTHEEKKKRKEDKNDAAKKSRVDL